GLTMIVASVVLFRETTPFPGVTALLPCGGTALVLLAGSGEVSLAGRLMNFSLLGFFGAISYSLYLWHWPVLVLGRTVFLDGPTRLQSAVLVLTAMLAASISWRWIEQPFLQRRGSRLRVLACGGATMAIAGCIAAAITFSGGFPARFGAP